MKKFFLIFVMLLLLAGCGKGEVVNESRTVAWYSMTFEIPEKWEVISASETKLEIGHGLGFMTFTREADISAYGEYGKITIAGQNYRFVDGEDSDIYTTSWEKKNVLIETNLNVDAAQKVLQTIRKPRLEWQGYEFERPGGLDWFLESEKELSFVLDDGDFLENEVNSLGDVQFNVLLSEEIFEESDYPEATYYNEVNFDGAKYRIVRLYDENTETNMVLYAGYLKGGDFVWIGGDEAYNDDMQDILNEIIDL